MNLFTPTRKPIGWSQDDAGRRKRIYDTPATPLDRLLDSGTLSRKQMQQSRQLRENTNPAELTRDILRYQSILTGMAKTPTEQLLAKREKTREKRKNKLTTGIKTHAA